MRRRNLTGGVAMNEFQHLLANPAHWAFEVVTDVAFTTILFVIGRIPFQRWVRRHDREQHGQPAHLRSDHGH